MRTKAERIFLVANPNLFVVPVTCVRWDNCSQISFQISGLQNFENHWILRNDWSHLSSSRAQTFFGFDRKPRKSLCLWVCPCVILLNSSLCRSGNYFVLFCFIQYIYAIFMLSNLYLNYALTFSISFNVEII